MLEVVVWAFATLFIVRQLRQCLRDSCSGVPSFPYFKPRNRLKSKPQLKHQPWYMQLPKTPQDIRANRQQLQTPHPHRIYCQLETTEEVEEPEDNAFECKEDKPKTSIQSMKKGARDEIVVPDSDSVNVEVQQRYYTFGWEPNSQCQPEAPRCDVDRPAQQTSLRRSLSFSPPPTAHRSKLCRQLETIEEPEEPEQSEKSAVEYEVHKSKNTTELMKRDTGAEVAVDFVKLNANDRPWYCMHGWKSKTQHQPETPRCVEVRPEQRTTTTKRSVSFTPPSTMRPSKICRQLETTEEVEEPEESSLKCEGHKSKNVIEPMKRGSGDEMAVVHATDHLNAKSQSKYCAFTWKPISQYQPQPKRQPEAPRCDEVRPRQQTAIRRSASIAPPSTTSQCNIYYELEITEEADETEDSASKCEEDELKNSIESMKRCAGDKTADTDNLNSDGQPRHWRYGWKSNRQCKPQHMYQSDEVRPHQRTAMRQSQSFAQHSTARVGTVYCELEITEEAEESDNPEERKERALGCRSGKSKNTTKSMKRCPGDNTAIDSDSGYLYGDTKPRYGMYGWKSNSHYKSRPMYHPEAPQHNGNYRSPKTAALPSPSFAPNQMIRRY